MKSSILHFALLAHPQYAYDRMLISGVAQFAQEHPECHFKLMTPEMLPVALTSGTYDGIICRILDRSILRQVERMGLPVVDTLSAQETAGFSVVSSDNVQIGRMAAEHFLEHRFRNFAFVGYRNVLYSEQRRDGFLARLSEAGFQASVYEADASKWRSTIASRLPGFNEIITRDAGKLKRILQRLARPAAVFCCHDPRAMSVLECCQNAGLQVPADIAILGVDNDFIYSAFSYPRLSSIDPSAETIGFRAAETIAEIARIPSARRPVRRMLIPARRIVVRESTEVYPMKPAWLSDALVFIQHNATKGITAADVFADLGLSHTLVQTTFRKVLHSSVQKEIIAIRMEEAKRLPRETKLPVTKIAANCGFASMRYFSQAFTTFTGGISPSQFAAASAR